MKQTSVTYKYIQKKANSCEISDLRPISINSVKSKINDKAANQQIVNFLNVNQLLSERQHGYRHGKSTATAVLNIINKRIDKNEKKSCMP